MSVTHDPGAESALARPAPPSQAWGRRPGGEGLRALLARSIASQKAASEAELATIPAQIAELSRRLVALDRRLPACVRRLDELRALIGDRLGAFADAEFERLMAVPGVRDVQADGSTLLVITEPMSIEWNGARHALGAYRLNLDLAGDVRIDSVDKLGPKPAWDHPHVQDGLPCLGNLRAGVLKLIAEYELALAVRVLLDFLSTYDPEGAYTPIEGWPRSA
jgi:hypothetical protein